MPEPLDPVGQLSESARQTAARLETVIADLAALRGRLEGLETRLDGTNASVQRAGEGLEAMRSETGRIARLESALTQSRTDLAHEQDERQHELQAALAALQRQLNAEVERLGRSTLVLMPRLEALELATGRLDALERDRAAAARAAAALDARVEAVHAERTDLLEEVRRVEQRGQARLEEVVTQARDMQSELATWRGRLESQSETVREARAVADHMRTEVGAVEQAHHATVEAERLFEGRVEARLAEMHREAADTWARFLRERQADWALQARADAERDRAAATAATTLEQVLQRLEALEHDLPAGLTTRADEVSQLRRDLAAALGTWRLALGEAGELLEAAVGQTEAPAVLEERRQALRRSLRAQRAAREG